MRVPTENELFQFAHRMASHAGFTARSTQITKEELDQVARYIDEQIARLDHMIEELGKIAESIEDL